MAEKIKRVDKHIKLSQNTAWRLNRYIERVFGYHKPMSAIIEKAIVEFLDKEDSKQ